MHPAGPGIALCGRFTRTGWRGGEAMHWIDQIELCETLFQIREEAKSLVGEIADERRLLGLRRIVALLGYMVEHLEMVDGEPQPSRASRNLESTAKCRPS
jgi:hypothetical protein